jgi:integrase
MARGSVRKRGSIYYAYWRDDSGKQHAKSIGPRKKEADAFLDTVQAEVHAGTYREIKQATFSEFAKLWLDTYASVNVKASTLATYTSRIDGPYATAFGPRKLASITTEDVQRFLAHLSKLGRSAATTRAYLVLLRELFTHAILWGYLAHNPSDGIKAPRVLHREMDFLTPGEVRALLKAAQPNDYALLATACMTGMRQGELLALKWDDVDWRSGTIRVRRSLYRGQFVEPKSARSIRTIGMSKRLSTILMDHKLAAPYSPWDLLFCSKDGTTLDQANVYHRILQPTLTAAKMRRIRFHDLRHTYASMLINQGENLKYVQSQLGHASITTTVDRYGHLMPDAHVGASERLDATLFGSSPASRVDKLLTRTRKKKKARSCVSL